MKRQLLRIGWVKGDGSSKVMDWCGAKVKSRSSVDIIQFALHEATVSPNADKFLFSRMSETERKYCPAGTCNTMKGGNWPPYPGVFFARTGVFANTREAV